MWLCRVLTQQVSAKVCVSIASVCKEKLPWLQLGVFRCTNPRMFTDTHSFEFFNQVSWEQAPAKPAVGHRESRAVFLTLHLLSKIKYAQAGIGAARQNDFSNLRKTSCWILVLSQLHFLDFPSRLHLQGSFLQWHIFIKVFPWLTYQR